MISAVLLLLLTREPAQVTPGSFSQAREPQIVIDVDNRVYVTYGMGDAIFICASDNEGASFDQPIKVGEAGKLSLSMRRGPRIGVDKGVVTVTAIYGAQGKGRDGDVVAFRSGDKGRT